MKIQVGTSKTANTRMNFIHSSLAPSLSFSLYSPVFIYIPIYIYVCLCRQELFREKARQLQVQVKATPSFNVPQKRFERETHFFLLYIFTILTCIKSSYTHALQCFKSSTTIIVVIIIIMVFFHFVAHVLLLILQLPPATVDYTYNILRTRVREIISSCVSVLEHLQIPI